MDFLDHRLLALTFGIQANQQATPPDSFELARLSKLKLPESESMWTHLDAEIRADPDFQVALDELRNFSDRGCRDQDAVQTNVDNMLERITRSLYNSFGAHKLIAKRSFSFHQGNAANANYGAPEQLRALWREESRAKAEYLAT